MQDQPSLFSRSDTIFGVCEALGQDFGVPPLLLRLAFAFGVFWSPVAAIAAYLLLGLVVAVSRWVFPARSVVPATQASAQPLAENDDAPAPLAEVA